MPHCPVSRLPLTTPLTAQLLHTTKSRMDLLKERGILTVEDLLLYYPRKHEDLVTPRHISEISAQEKNLLIGSFSEVSEETSVRSKMHLTKATFTERESQTAFPVIWFRDRSVAKRLPLGRVTLVQTRVKYDKGVVTLMSPEWEVMEGKSQGINLGRITPVYREIGPVKSSWIRERMSDLLSLAQKLPEIIPEKQRQTLGIMERHEALRALHFPESGEQLKEAKKTLALNELFVFQLLALQRKAQYQAQESPSLPSLELDVLGEETKSFLQTLPFSLTNGQKIALYEILRDMSMQPTRPMLRLLEGDVGSGKTLVALAASIPLMQRGHQVAMMVPTEVLAQQHGKSLRKRLQESGLQLRVAVLTGSTPQKERNTILQELKEGVVDLIIGTHALLEESVEFLRLGMVVIDEQHRFGVGQRQIMREKGSPHILQMTATPIPRTLALAAYGDMDLSVITELPPGRKPIITKVVPESARAQTYLFLETQIEAGRQVFCICPLVEESENLEAKSAEEVYESLSQQVYPQYRVGLLHGKMRPKEKQEVMRKFEAHEYDILVSTAVIEVGIDIPNASSLIIYSAERFGLAQLHQFRGRVGRGEHQSYCFLLPDGAPTRRLRAMEQEASGFQLSEIDLQIRGMGEVYGRRQSGMPDMQMVEAGSDGRLTQMARKAAEEFLEKSDVEEHPALQQALKEHEGAYGV